MSTLENKYRQRRANKRCQKIGCKNMATRMIQSTGRYSQVLLCDEHYNNIRYDRQNPETKKKIRKINNAKRTHRTKS